MEITPRAPVRRRRGRTVAVTLAVVALLLVGVTAAAPVVLGLQRLAMADDAMGSSLPKGSYVLVRRVPVRAMAAGDVVGIRPRAGADVLVRRITGRTGDRLEVAGDAAPARVATVAAADTRRVVWHVPVLGWPMLLLPAWFVPALGVALLLAFAARLGWSARRSSRARRVAPAFLVPAPAPAPSVPLEAPAPPASLPLA
jgi:hypothetical protein